MRPAGELLRQVAELRAASEDEHHRRGELEGALREASAIFKRELQDKNEQLDLLRRELRWGQRAVQCGRGRGCGLVRGLGLGGLF